MPMWERGYLELRGSDRTFRSNASHHRRGLVTTSGGWVVHVEERLLGANAEAIAFPVPTVQNKQDSPEDSGHWELRGSDRPSGQ
jgi:hypothetical protein